MEPLHPDLRAALKQAHPGLTDETIDRVEALLVRRFELDPSRHAERIAELDRERQALIAREIPHYAAVVQAWAARATLSAEQRPKVTIQNKRAIQE